MHCVPHQKSSGQPRLLQWGVGGGRDRGAKSAIMSIFSTPQPQAMTSQTRLRVS